MGTRRPFRLRLDGKNGSCPPVRRPVDWGDVSMKWQGEVVGIYITPVAGGRLSGVTQVEAVSGKGLIGDRYYGEKGTFSKPEKDDREVTLIESEALDALRRDYKLEFKPEDTRRNIHTRGVPLNHLVGEEFRVGDVRLRGLRLCEPCGYLAGMVSDAFSKALVHRGGLRAKIIDGGVIHVGDAVLP